jgi:hypothetical protein
MKPKTINMIMFMLWVVISVVSFGVLTINIFSGGDNLPSQISFAVLLVAIPTTIALYHDNF